MTGDLAVIIIATDIHLIFFLFLDENICCGYSLEAPRRGASNEYPQHTFSSRNKQNISAVWLKKVPYLELCVLNRTRLPAAGHFSPFET